MLSRRDCIAEVSEDERRKERGFLENGYREREETTSSRRQERGHLVFEAYFGVFILARRLCPHFIMMQGNNAFSHEKKGVCAM